jgi:hypothetical protein
VSDRFVSTIRAVVRLPDSAAGNPAWEVLVEGFLYRTAEDATIGELVTVSMVGQFAEITLDDNNDIIGITVMRQPRRPR